MKITEIGISVSRTFNLGNFESLRVEATATASVEDVREIEVAKVMLLGEIRETLRSTYEDFRPKKKEAFDV
jgi:hypothetical protein